MHNCCAAIAAIYTSCLADFVYMTIGDARARNLMITSIMGNVMATIIEFENEDKEKVRENKE